MAAQPTYGEEALDIVDIMVRRVGRRGGGRARAGMAHPRQRGAGRVLRRGLKVVRSSALLSCCCCVCGGTASQAASGALDLIVVDSVSALVPRAELEGDIGQAQVREHLGSPGAGAMWGCGWGACDPGDE